MMMLMSGICWLSRQIQACGKGRPVGGYPDVHQTTLIHWKVRKQSSKVMFYEVLFYFCCTIALLFYCILCVCSDLVKMRSTCFKLIALHKEFNQQNKVIDCYDKIISTYVDDLSQSDANDLSKLWLEFGNYLMSRDEISDSDWMKVCRQICSD